MADQGPGPGDPGGSGAKPPDPRRDESPSLPRRANASTNHPAQAEIVTNDLWPQVEKDTTSISSVNKKTSGVAIADRTEYTADVTTLTYSPSGARADTIYNAAPAAITNDDLWSQVVQDTTSISSIDDTTSGVAVTDRTEYTADVKMFAYSPKGARANTIYNAAHAAITNDDLWSQVVQDTTSISSIDDTTSGVAVADRTEYTADAKMFTQKFVGDDSADSITSKVSSLSKSDRSIPQLFADKPYSPYHQAKYPPRAWFPYLFPSTQQSSIAAHPSPPVPPAPGESHRSRSLVDAIARNLQVFE